MTNLTFHDFFVTTLAVETAQTTLHNQQQVVNMEEKSGQWLGAVVHSSGKDGKVVVSTLTMARRFPCMFTYTQHF